MTEDPINGYYDLTLLICIQKFGLTVSLQGFYVEGGKGRRRLFTYLFSYIVDFCPTPPPSTGINDEEFLLICHKFN